MKKEKINTFFITFHYWCISLEVPNDQNNSEPHQECFFFLYLLGPYSPSCKPFLHLYLSLLLYIYVECFNIFHLLFVLLEIVKPIKMQQFLTLNFSTLFAGIQISPNYDKADKQLKVIEVRSPLMLHCDFNDASRTELEW